jgi:hypothetical protein
VQIAWITAEGDTLPSTEKGVAVSASTGAVLVAIPAIPTNGATIIGWTLFTAGTTTTEEQNTVAASTSPAPSTIATTQGNISGFPIATTSVLLKVYGTGAVPPVVNQSGIQQPLPSVAQNSTADYDFIVPNTGSQWKVYKSVQVVRPDGTPETSGIVLSSALGDCIQPTYGQLTNNASGVYQQVAVPNGTYVVVNGYLYVATQSGSANTASTFSAQYAGFAAAQTKGATFTDGSVVWQSLGKAALVRVHFGNVTGSAATPAAQQYDLFEL